MSASSRRPQTWLLSVSKGVVADRMEDGRADLSIRASAALGSGSMTSADGSKFKSNEIVPVLSLILPLVKFTDRSSSAS